MGRRCSWSARDPISQSILTHSSTSERLLSVESSSELAGRAARHAALGDPARLAIVDELSVSDRAPVDLRRRLDMESNLLAHHLDVLERVGLIERSRSSGDGRRRYVHLLRGAARRPRAESTHFRPGARCSCAARTRHVLSWPPRCGVRPPANPLCPRAPIPRTGSTPARCRRPPSRARSRRRAVPHELDDVGAIPPLVITVCDRAHEELDPDDSWLHWSIPDPVPVGTKAAFDAAVADLRDRIRTFVALPEAS